MSGGTIRWDTDQFDLLMIVHDLNLVGTLLGSEKTDAILIIEPDAELAQ